MNKFPPPIVFILPAQPAPKDVHKYNAFGINKSFGKAYAAYYAKLDIRDAKAGGK